MLETRKGFLGRGKMCFIHEMIKTCHIHVYSWNDKKKDLKIYKNIFYIPDIIKMIKTHLIFLKWLFNARSTIIICPLSTFNSGQLFDKAFGRTYPVVNAGWLSTRLVVTSVASWAHNTTTFCHFICIGKYKRIQKVLQQRRVSWKFIHKGTSYLKVNHIWHIRK